MSNEPEISDEIRDAVLVTALDAVFNGAFAECFIDHYHDGVQFRHFPDEAPHGYYFGHLAKDRWLRARHTLRDLRQQLCKCAGLPPPPEIIIPLGPNKASFFARRIESALQRLANELGGQFGGGIDAHRAATCVGTLAHLLERNEAEGWLPANVLARMPQHDRRAA
jgi:hypothetical protein